MIPWIKKYAPKNSSEIVNQQEAIKKLKDFIVNYKKQQKKAALLYGPPGTGKTSSVYAIANELNYEVVEMNASDVRSAVKVHQILDEAVKSKPFFKNGRIILIDEVDGMAGRADKGGVGAIINIIEVSLWPVILTANDPWDPNLKKLRDMCEMIEFKKLTTTDIFKALKRIVISEKIQVDDEILRQIAERSSGDLRSAINDLQTIASKGYVTQRDLSVLGYRDREITIFQALGQMFKSSTIFGATIPFSNVDMDPEEIEPWVEENISNEYEDLEEIFEAYRFLMLAKVFHKRIYKRQYWELLKYYTTLMYAGVALAKKKRYQKFTKYVMPNYLRRLSRNKEVREKISEITKNLKERVHASRKRIREVYLNVLIALLEKNPEIGKKYGKALGLTDSELEYIRNAIKQL